MAHRPGQFKKNCVFSRLLVIKLTKTIPICALIIPVASGLLSSESQIRNKRYHNVFFLAEGSSGGGGGYETSAVRMESHQTALLISRQIQEAYRRYGYELIAVPAGMSLSERCKFVEGHIGKGK